MIKTKNIFIIEALFYFVLDAPLGGLPPNTPDFVSHGAFQQKKIH